MWWNKVVSNKLLQETARLLKQEYYEELRREIKVHESILERKRKEKYEKNYKYCKSIVHSYLELAFKIAEYRSITNKFVWFLFWLDIFYLDLIQF